MVTRDFMNKCLGRGYSGVKVGDIWNSDFGAISFRTLYQDQIYPHVALKMIDLTSGATLFFRLTLHHFVFN